jgi:diguanylate cyclase (GGDEF)-like protein
MGFEAPNNSAKEGMSKRVEDLRKTDNKYEDSIHDLAVAEDEHRGELKSDGFVERDLLNKYGDKHSTVVLEKIEAEKKKWIDEMTGLRNKNAFNEELPNIVSLELRSGQHCAMLMLDFDHFKKVNDEYGHDAGDQALKQLATIIKNSVRNSDLMYRYGGEEFVVFLPDTDSSQARIVAEKIRANAADSIMHINANSQGDLEQKEIILKKTISIGMVSSDQLDAWKDNGKNNSESIRDEMLKKADSALYEAKNGGRNRVNVWNE